MDRSKMSPAQRAALEQYPNATVMLNDFSLALGYAECYRQRVEPLLKIARELFAALDEERKAYDMEDEGCIFADIIGNADALLKEYDK